MHRCCQATTDHRLPSCKANSGDMQHSAIAGPSHTRCCHTHLPLLLQLHHEAHLLLLRVECSHDARHAGWQCIELLHLRRWLVRHLLHKYARVNRLPFGSRLALHQAQAQVSSTGCCSPIADKTMCARQLQNQTGEGLHPRAVHQ